jgi:hypothetical protein
MITVHARSGAAHVTLHFLSSYIGPALGSEHFKSVVVLQRCYLIFRAWTLPKILHIVEHVSHCFVICEQVVTTLFEALQRV